MQPVPPQNPPPTEEPQGGPANPQPAPVQAKQPQQKPRYQYKRIGDSIEDGRKIVEKKTKKGNFLEVFESINAPKGKQT